jgi:cytochrome c biogenesis protein CcdA
MVFDITLFAVVDSLNAVTISFVIYLLGARKAVLKTLSFVCGLFLGHFLSGVLILTGWVIVMEYLLGQMRDHHWRIGEMVLGLVLVLYGIYQRFKPGKNKALSISPDEISQKALFSFAFLGALAYAPTDIPYHIAVYKIVSHTRTIIEFAAWLTYFNLIYVLPLFVLMLIKIWAPFSVNKVFDKVTWLVSHIIKKYLSYFLILLGLFLVIRGLVNLGFFG